MLLALQNRPRVRLFCCRRCQSRHQSGRGHAGHGTSAESTLGGGWASRLTLRHIIRQPCNSGSKPGTSQQLHPTMCRGRGTAMSSRREVGHRYRDLGPALLSCDADPNPEPYGIPSYAYHRSTRRAARPVWPPDPGVPRLRQGTSYVVQLATYVGHRYCDLALRYFPTIPTRTPRCTGIASYAYHRSARRADPPRLGHPIKDFLDCRDQRCACMLSRGRKTDRHPPSPAPTLPTRDDGPFR